MECLLLVIMQVMKLTMPIAIAFIAVAMEAPAVLADYTIQLKSGGRLTVQNYREDRDMIKFNGLGGEISLNKDQVLSISPASAKDSAGLNLQQLEPTRSLAAAGPPSAPQAGTDATNNSGPTPEQQRAKEEKQYLDKVQQLTSQLKDARDQYSEAVRGTSGAQPSELNSDEQLRAHNADVTSRFKNAQHNPSQPEPVKLLVPSPFSGLPPTTESVTPAPFPAAIPGPPPYTEKERELSDLRERANQIERERDQVINEMRQKKFNTGSLFLE